jgi:sterol 24-C-methyltransferase
MRLVNVYYELVTTFYEYGWGKSFHFARRAKNESLRESILRAEHYLALQLKPGMNVLDIGCGVGGPMRNIARFSGASITGINNSDHQIVRGKLYNNNEGLSPLCTFLKVRQ